MLEESDTSSEISCRKDALNLENGDFKTSIEKAITKLPRIQHLVCICVFLTCLSKLRTSGMKMVQIEYKVVYSFARKSLSSPMAKDYDIRVQNNETERNFYG